MAEKTAVLAPMPSASVINTVRVKPGVRASVRTAYRDVPRRSVHPGCHIDVAGSLTLNAGVAELNPRASNSLFPAQALSLQLLSPFRDVEGKLAIDVALDPARPECVEQTSQP